MKKYFLLNIFFAIAFHSLKAQSTFVGELFPTIDHSGTITKHLDYPKLSIRNRNERLKYKEDKGSRNIFRRRNSDVYFEEKNRADPYTQSSLTL